MKPCNENLSKSLELSNQLLFLADNGDMEREDSGCGVIYGIMRDAGYRIKTEVAREIENHKKSGKWED
jgi:hypothetical protein